MAERFRRVRRTKVNEHVPDQAKLVGPPKTKDRRILTAMIGIMAVVVLVLIAFVALSDFPGAPEGSEDKSLAPPEDVRR